MLQPILSVVPSFLDGRTITRCLVVVTTALLSSPGCGTTWYRIPRNEMRAVINSLEAGNSTTVTAYGPQGQASKEVRPNDQFRFISQGRLLYEGTLEALKLVNAQLIELRPNEAMDGELAKGGQIHIGMIDSIDFAEPNTSGNTVVKFVVVGLLLTAALLIASLSSIDGFQSTSWD